jgi:ABC-type dipeptide/oligopeptide/nickel transport system permease subunit
MTTSPATLAPAAAPELTERPGRLTTIGRFLRYNPLALAGIIIFICAVLISIFAPFIAPYEPLEQDIVNRLQSPSVDHWFGTDQLGRDIFSRVLYGGRLSLPAGIMVVLFAGLVGTVLGAISGFIGGWFDEMTMRLTEVFLAFPTIILAMAVAAALGPSLINAVVAMVVVWWPHYARVVRSLVIGVKSQEYVEAGRATGVPTNRLLWRTVLPNCLAPAIVLATIDLGNAILVFAGLSFLGLGPEPSSPEWGRMVADGIEYFDQWWMSAFPGMAIFLVVIAFNFLGDGIRDALDPRLRKAK